MKQEVREISDILTHIESEPATIETSDGLLRVPRFEERLQAVTQGFPEVVDVHDLMFKRVGGRLYLSAAHHDAGRSAALARPRYPDSRRRPLSPGSAGAVPRIDSPRANYG